MSDPQMEPVGDGPIDFEDAWKRFNIYLAWLCELYVNIMNIIHFMHDRYDYESAQMAFLNSELKRLMAIWRCLGFSVRLTLSPRSNMRRYTDQRRKRRHRGLQN